MSYETLKKRYDDLKKPTTNLNASCKNPKTML